jgi:hypothetical protein
MCLLQGTLRFAVSHVTSPLVIHESCIVLGTLRTTITWRASFFVVQFNGFMSLTSYFDVTTLLTLLKPHIPASFNINLVINYCVTPVNVSNFSGYYL